MDRNQLKEKRRQIVCREQRNQALLERLLPFLYESDVLGLYCPIDAEADVWNSLRRRSNIVLCRVMPKRQMKFFPAEHLSRSAWGLLEPEVTEEVIPDILIAPMLGFDVKEDGIFRIGYGGGYYDRYFASHPKCLRVGIAYQGQQTTLSVQPWDEGLDVLVTEKQVYFSPVLREEIAPEWKKRLERYREEQS